MQLALVLAISQHLPPMIGVRVKRKMHVSDAHTTCRMSGFGNWTPCTSSCGGGVRIRHRFILGQKVGAVCPPTLAIEKCGLVACSEGGCQTARWGLWSTCSETCGEGSRTRTRIRDVSVASRACAVAQTETQDCKFFPCPVDCEVVWKWGACGESCGKGRRIRHSAIRIQPANGGVQCPKLLSDCHPCRLRRPQTSTLLSKGRTQKASHRNRGDAQDHVGAADAAAGDAQRRVHLNLDMEVDSLVSEGDRTLFAEAIAAAANIPASSVAIVSVKQVPGRYHIAILRYCVYAGLSYTSRTNIYCIYMRIHAYTCTVTLLQKGLGRNTFGVSMTVSMDANEAGANRYWHTAHLEAE
jgi:hypothetical protein